MLSNADIHNLKELSDSLATNIFFLGNKRVSQSGLEAIAESQKQVLEIQKLLKRAYIPIEQCVHGNLYYVSARNFAHAVYNQETKGFIGLRDKLDKIFLFTESHWDSCPVFGTCMPLRDELTVYTGDINDEESNRDLFRFLYYGKKDCATGG